MNIWLPLFWSTWSLSRGPDSATCAGLAHGCDHSYFRASELKLQRCPASVFPWILENTWKQWPTATAHWLGLGSKAPVGYGPVAGRHRNRRWPKSAESMSDGRLRNAVHPCLIYLTTCIVSQFHACIHPSARFPARQSRTRDAGPTCRRPGGGRAGLGRRLAHSGRSRLPRPRECAACGRGHWRARAEPAATRMSESYESTAPAEAAPPVQPGPRPGVDSDHMPVKTARRAPRTPQASRIRPDRPDSFGPEFGRIARPAGARQAPDPRRDPGSTRRRPGPGFDQGFDQRFDRRLRFARGGPRLV